MGEDGFSARKEDGDAVHEVNAQRNTSILDHDNILSSYSILRNENLLMVSFGNCILSILQNQFPI